MALRAKLRDLSNERGVLDTDGCSSCCGKTESRQASIASIVFIVQKGYRSASGQPGGVLSVPVRLS